MKKNNTVPVHRPVENEQTEFSSSSLQVGKRKGNQRYVYNTQNDSTTTREIGEEIDMRRMPCSEEEEEEEEDVVGDAAGEEAVADDEASEGEGEESYTMPLLVASAL